MNESKIEQGIISFKEIKGMRIAYTINNQKFSLFVDKSDDIPEADVGDKVEVRYKENMSKGVIYKNIQRINILEKNKNSGGKLPEQDLRRSAAEMRRTESLKCACTMSSGKTYFIDDIFKLSEKFEEYLKEGKKDKSKD